MILFDFVILVDLSRKQFFKESTSDFFLGMQPNKNKLIFSIDVQRLFVQNFLLHYVTNEPTDIYLSVQQSSSANKTLPVSETLGVRTGEILGEVLYPEFPLIRGSSFSFLLSTPLGLDSPSSRIPAVPKMFCCYFVHGVGGLNLIQVPFHCKSTKSSFFKTH